MEYIGELALTGLTNGQQTDFKIYILIGPIRYQDFYLSLIGVVLFCVSGNLLQLAGHDTRRFGEKSLYYVSL